MWHRRPMKEFSVLVAISVRSAYRPGDWLSWVTDLTGLLYFRVRGTSFHNSSPLLTFFCCFIVLFQSCCSRAQVFWKTLVHEFPTFYSHTEWNLLSSGTNTLLWWRACYKRTKLQTNNTFLSLDTLHVLT